jgi:integrase
LCTSVRHQVRVCRSFSRTAGPAVSSITWTCCRCSSTLTWSYADQWIEDYARIECKTSTADGYEGVLRQYLRPRFGTKRLDEIKRNDIKALINDLVGKELSRNIIRNALCVIRGLFNQAIEEELLESNPAARLGRFTRSAKTAETKGVALTTREVQQFLKAAQEICPDYYPLLLMAVRTGLRRGELVALQWGDLQLGGDGDLDRLPGGFTSQPAVQFLGRGM